MFNIKTEWRENFIFLIHCHCFALHQHKEYELWMQFFSTDPLRESSSFTPPSFAFRRPHSRHAKCAKKKKLFSVHWIVIIFPVCVEFYVFLWIIMHFMSSPLLFFLWNNKQLPASREKITRLNFFFIPFHVVRGKYAIGGDGGREEDYWKGQEEVEGEMNTCLTTI